jgi:fatty acid-binding protein DegV
MLQRMLDYAKQRHDSGADAWVVQHVSAPDEAAELIEQCRAVFECEPLFVSEVGPVLSAHIGPGMLGVGSVPKSMFAN